MPTAPLVSRRLAALLLPLSVLAALSCHKKDEPTPLEQLPPATMSGADTWGCLVNGRVWKESGLSHVRADWTLPNVLYFSMGFPEEANGRTVYNGVIIGIDTSFTTGTYILGKSGTGHPFARLEVRSNWYENDQLLNGKLILTRVDTQAGIASGTFEFTMAGTYGDTIRITQGRFDISHMDL